MGAGSTASSKYMRINSSIAGTGTLNQYKMTVTLGTSSSSVYNYDGVNIYAVIDGTSSLLGKITISAGVCSTTSFSKTFTVTKNTSCYAKCSDAKDSSLANFINQTAADTATYTSPAVAPSAPTSISLTGAYADGETQRVSWSGATGTITKYEVLHKVYELDKNAWSDWYGSGTTTNTYMDIGHNNVSSLKRSAIKYGVRAWNGTLSSSIKESAVTEHHCFRVYNNGWKFAEAYRWTGSAWSKINAYKWNGSAWVYI